MQRNTVYLFSYWLEWPFFVSSDSEMRSSLVSKARKLDSLISQEFDFSHQAVMGEQLKLTISGRFHEQWRCWKQQEIEKEQWTVKSDSPDWSVAPTSRNSWGGWGMMSDGCHGLSPPTTPQIERPFQNKCKVPYLLTEVQWPLPSV